jgi:hypothetical protein
MGAATFFADVEVTKDYSNESLREEMWMENRGTESFGYNLETNHHFWFVNAEGNHYTSFGNGGYAYQNKPQKENTPKAKRN